MSLLLYQKVILLEIFNSVDIEKLSKKSHIEELSKITHLLSSTQQNLELAGSLLEEIEARVTNIEKKLGMESDDIL